MSKCNYNCNTLQYLIFTPLEIKKKHMTNNPFQIKNLQILYSILTLFMIIYEL